MGVSWSHYRRWSPLSDRASWQDLIASLDWLPVAALILDRGGMALRANSAWTALSSSTLEPSSPSSTSFSPAARVTSGFSWLEVVEPADRHELRARLTSASADVADSAYCRLKGESRSRWSRWWWRPGPVGQLIVCVAELAPLHDAEPLDALH